MFSRRFTASFLCLLAFSGGCFGRPYAPSMSVEPPDQVQNPLFIPGGDREYVWNAIVDQIDDDFAILREQRIHLVSGVLTEGTIETRPKVASTLLEPWRGDSAPGYERLHSTLQSLRRTARARVIPVENGYLLDLTVLKELEDLDQPVGASSSAVIQRHDSSIIREEVPPGSFSLTPGWIPLGRDSALESKMLRNLKARLCDHVSSSQQAPAEL